jgi:uncharacterized protein (DUF2236 family)
MIRLPASVLCLVLAGLLLGSGCASRPDWIEATLVTVDVTGTWRGTLTSVMNTTVELIRPARRAGDRDHARLRRPRAARNGRSCRG